MARHFREQIVESESRAAANTAILVHNAVTGFDTCSNFSACTSCRRDAVHNHAHCAGGSAAKGGPPKKKGTTLPLTSFLKPEMSSWADDDPESETREEALPAGSSPSQNTQRFRKIGCDSGCYVQCRLSQPHREGPRPV